MINWRTDIENAPRDRAMLLFNPQMRDDEDYPGHPYVVSNPDYAHKRFHDHGYTHWAEINEPEE